MKRIKTRAITLLALCIALNIVGSNIALMLKLPIYFRFNWYRFGCCCVWTTGWNVGRGATGVIVGATTDLYSLFFMPVQLLTGLVAGLLYRRIKPGTWAVKLVASWCYFTSRTLFIHGDYGHLISWHHIVWFEHASPIIIRYRYGAKRWPSS
jgi:hypothetical protein